MCPDLAPVLLNPAQEFDPDVDHRRGPCCKFYSD